MFCRNHLTVWGNEKRVYFYLAELLKVIKQGRELIVGFTSFGNRTNKLGWQFELLDLGEVNHKGAKEACNGQGTISFNHSLAMLNLGSHDPPLPSKLFLTYFIFTLSKLVKLYNMLFDSSWSFCVVGFFFFFWKKKKRKKRKEIALIEYDWNGKELKNR